MGLDRGELKGLDYFPLGLVEPRGGPVQTVTPVSVKWRFLQRTTNQGDAFCILRDKGLSPPSSSQSPQTHAHAHAHTGFRTTSPHSGMRLSWTHRESQTNNYICLKIHLYGAKTHIIIKLFK